MIETVSGMGAAAALCVSAFAVERERRGAMASAALLLAGWLLYNAPWHGWGLHVWTGLDNASCWALQDSLAAGIILSLWWQRLSFWLIAIWGIYIAQIGCHAAYFLIGNAIWAPYEKALDAGFYLQLAVLFGVGGPGAFNAATNYLSRRWASRDQAKTAFAESRQSPQ